MKRKNEAENFSFVFYSKKDFVVCGKEVYEEKFDQRVYTPNTDFGTKVKALKEILVKIIRKE